MPLASEVRERLLTDAAQILARYPQKRSALLPLLHLVQAEQGYVSPEGIELCAELLELTTAEVSAVATFYTMYKRRPNGEYSVGVCTNTLCAVMGGDAIFASLKEHLGVGNDETTEDGMVTLEHIECNAACDYAPVVMVNWEFFDNQTPDTARELVDRLRSGEPVQSTRGPRVCSFRETERLLAGFYDGLAGEGPSAGPATMAGVDIALEQGWSRDGDGSRNARRNDAAEREEGLATGYGNQGGPSGSDAPAATAESDSANSADPAHEEDK